MRDPLRREAVRVDLAVFMYGELRKLLNGTMAEDENRTEKIPEQISTIAASPFSTKSLERFAVVLQDELISIKDEDVRKQLQLRVEMRLSELVMMETKSCTSEMETENMVIAWLNNV